ncbi:hypothetical protein BaRGS_00001811, partial [Batillaria attramentaria]
SKSPKSPAGPEVNAREATHPTRVLCLGQNHSRGVCQTAMQATLAPPHPRPSHCFLSRLETRQGRVAPREELLASSRLLTSAPMAELRRWQERDKDPLQEIARQTRRPNEQWQARTGKWRSEDRRRYARVNTESFDGATKKTEVDRESQEGALESPEHFSKLRMFSDNPRRPPRPRTEPLELHCRVNVKNTTTPTTVEQ